MTKLVFDLEADELREGATRIWCIVFKNIETEERFEFTYENPDLVSDIAYMFDHCDMLIGHNIIDYDLPVIERLLGVTYNGDIFDTLVVSRLLNPDRPDGHSLDAWGLRLGRKKPEHEDWTQFSPEMLHRCKEDVEINHLVYEKLLEEEKK